MDAAQLPNFFLIQVGCPVYLAKDPACLKQERSSPRRLDTGFFFEISAWSSFQKERCEEKRLDHVEDQDSDEDRSWRSLMTM